MSTGKAYPKSVRNFLTRGEKPRVTGICEECDSIHSVVDVRLAEPASTQACLANSISYARIWAYEVGETARRIYDPLGQGTLIDINAEGFEAAFARTSDLVANSRNPIFEAAFRMHGALALADVLLPDWLDGKPAWRMVEVKSSTRVKDYHHDDIAVQSFIARSSGVRLTSVALAHIDSSWTYPGVGDYSGLLAENDLTEEALARAEEVGQWLAGAQELVAKPDEPVVATGPQCSTPFECGFCNYCNREKVWPEYPLSSIPRFSQKRKTACEELGIDDLRNVPDDLLGLLQRRVKSHTVSQTSFFDAEGAKAALARHGFPARFLDFETSTMPVPVWQGTRPYQQIPFQFSLHTLTDDGVLEHAEFSRPERRRPFRRLRCRSRRSLRERRTDF